LFTILAEYGVDLGTYKRAGSLNTVWVEIVAARKQRNGIVHRAESVSPDDAEQAITVAEVVLEELLPKVLARLACTRIRRDGVCAL
jgi:hypothetical protein